MQKISFFTVIAYMLLACSIYSNAAAGNKTTKIIFTPQWTPQAQFAGYYMAKSKKIYEKYGLDVEIKHAGPYYSARKALESGKADFITQFLASGIKMRANGAAIVEIAQISQTSALMFVSKKSSGIKKPEDLQGKKLGLWKSDFQDIPKAFLKKYKASPKIIPISTGVNLFLWDGIDAVTVMWYNEYHKILNHGINKDEINTFFFSKLGFNIPEDGIFCKESYYLKNPEICRKFAKASIEGWLYAAKHKNETLNTVTRIMKEAHAPVNTVHQKWMLSRMIDLIFPNKNKMEAGRLTKTQYENTAQILLQSKSIKNIPDFKQYYKPVTENVQK